MRQVLGAGALGRPTGIGQRGRWEGGSGWGIHVTPWLIHVSVWQNPLKCCEVISLQLIKINKKKREKKSTGVGCHCFLQGIFLTQGLYWIYISYISCIARQFLYHCATREGHKGVIFFFLKYSLFTILYLFWVFNVFAIVMDSIFL